MTERNKSLLGLRPRATWHDLPMELIIQIAKVLWTHDAISLSSTCRLYHTSLSDVILARYIHLNPRPRAERLLAWAVDHGSVSIARKVLNLGVEVRWSRDVTARTPSPRPTMRSRTPLLRAIQRENLEMVDLLLRHGADVMTRTEDDTTLTLAVKLGSLDIAARLLDHAGSLPVRETNNRNDKLLASSLANSRPIDSQVYALHHAAETGQIAAILLLLEHGAYIDVRDDRGNTPLHVTLAEGKIATAKVLLGQGADIAGRNDAGRDALSLAARMPRVTTEERVDLVREIIKTLETATSHTAEDDGGLRISDTQASELLASGQTSIIRLVLDAGFQPDCTSSSWSSPEAPTDQGTPLWKCASLRAPPWGDGPVDTEGVKLLIDAGADVNLAHPVTLETPAMQAARHGRDDILRLLISRGADMTTVTRDRKGKTVLAHAATGRTGIKPLRTLLEHHHERCADGSLSPRFVAQLEAADSKGRTPLIQALLAGRFTPAAMLIEAGADVVRCRDHLGRSALCLAVQRHPLDPAELILARLAAQGISAAEGIDNVVTGSGGETPLTQAVMWNCRAGALLLIAAGADVNVARICQVTTHHRGEAEVVVVREWAETALTTAVRRNDVVLVKALLEAGASVRRAMEGQSGPLSGRARGLRATTGGQDDVGELLERYGALEVEAELAGKKISDGGV